MSDAFLHKLGDIKRDVQEVKEDLRLLRSGLVQIPPYDSHHVEVWFAQVEASFALHSVTDELRKYQILLSHLDPKAACINSFRGLVLNTPENRPYSTLKSAMVNAPSSRHC